MCLPQPSIPTKYLADKSECLDKHYTPEAGVEATIPGAQASHQAADRDTGRQIVIVISSALLSALLSCVVLAGDKSDAPGDRIALWD
jgi:hypothetical protein